MRLRKQKFAPFFALVFIAMLVLPALSGLRTRTVEAQGQNADRRDVPATAKPPRGPRTPPKGAQPANDNCASAVAVTSADCPFTDTVNTGGAGDEAGEPQSTCTLQANSVWYSFTTSATGGALVTVETCTSDFDTAVMIWQPMGMMCDFANFTPIACNDDACGDGLQSRVSFFAESGVTYKIQVGGFDGDTGNLTVDIDCDELVCPQIVIDGNLGNGSAMPPEEVVAQTSGLQLGRLNRNGIASTCDMPKMCDIFDPVGLRAFDAYSITNQTADPQCVTVTLEEDADETCNLQSNAYVMSYDPNNICTNYLADPGLSTGVPPTPTNMSFIVPGGATFIVVVHTTNPGESGCDYTVTIRGNLCLPFDCCVQSDNGNAFLLFNSQTGDYIFQECSKGLMLQGKGTVGRSFCKVTLMDTGMDPKRPDRFVSAVVNKPNEINEVCTFRGTADIRTTHKGALIRIIDSDVRNSTCVCPGAQ